MAKISWILLALVTFVWMNSCETSSRVNSSFSFYPNFTRTFSIQNDLPKDNDTGELKTFQAVENKVRRIIDGVIRQLLPYVIRASGDIRLSGKCMASIFKVVIGMQKLREWAIRMVDATGKPPSGVIQGTSMSLGDFDECIGVRVGKGGKPPETKEEEYFHGKYCTVECRLPKGVLDAIDEYNAVPIANRSQTAIGKSKTFFGMLKKFSPFVKEAAFRFGVCIPSSCNEDDLGSIVSTATKNIGFPLKVLHCQEKPKLTFFTEHKIILTILGLMVSVVVAATAAEMWFSRSETGTTKTRSLLRQLADSFSLICNTRRLFHIDTVDDHPMPMMRGILFLTVVFNILAHTYLMYNHLFFYKYSSVLNYFEFMKQFSFSLVANGSNGIENYFFVAGFMISFVRWRVPMTAPKINITKLLVKPYIRMGLLQLLGISLFLCLPLIGFGPFWTDFVGPYLQNCRQRWWINLLFIQNYWSSEDSCLYHTWLFAVVMQLYVISALILWALIKKPTYGIVLILTIIVVGMAIVGATVFVKELPGALSLYLVDLESGTKMWNSLFIQTFDHVGAFSIGLLTGYILGRFQNTFKIKPMMVAVCWCVSLASLMAVIFGLFGYRFGGQQMNPSLAILYAMLNRNVYSLFLAWLAVAAATGNAWYIPNALSWKALIPGYRLSFLAYLIHLIVIYYHVGILRERVYLSHEENIINYFGYLMTSYILAFVCYLFFQAPYMYLEGALFRQLGNYCPQWAVDNANEQLANPGQNLTDITQKVKRPPLPTISDFCTDISTIKSPRNGTSGSSHKV